MNHLFQTLRQEDLPAIINTFNFPWTTLQKTQEKWEGYFAEQQSGDRIVTMVKDGNAFVGYGSLLKKSENPIFKDKGIPEINDLWISQEYRRHGLGRKLIQHLEEIAKLENYQIIGLGVGLYRDYGAAQRLYVQMGYIPDGNGVSYDGQLVVPGNSYPVDDELIIWLTKELV